MQAAGVRRARGGFTELRRVEIALPHRRLPAGPIKTFKTRTGRADDEVPLVDRRQYYPEMYSPDGNAEPIQIRQGDRVRIPLHELHDDVSPDAPARPLLPRAAAGRRVGRSRTRRSRTVFRSGRSKRSTSNSSPTIRAAGSCTVTTCITCSRGWRGSWNTSLSVTTPNSRRRDAWYTRRSPLCHLPIASKPGGSTCTLRAQSFDSLNRSSQLADI